jgi:hypothetical protein
MAGGDCRGYALANAGTGALQEPNGSIWGYIHGAVTAILISCTIHLALRSLGYLGTILIGLAVSAWLLREAPASEPLK